MKTNKTPFSTVSLSRIQLPKTLIASVIAASTITSYAQASELETVIVTETRTENSLENTLASASVFTSADIEQIQANNVVELLARIPGVSISQTGGTASVTSLNIRGTNTTQALVLIDGVRISSATLGATTIQHIDPDQIERIEVVKGIRSSIYGADAVGGVIQIFTKKGGAEEGSANASITGGSNNYSRLSLSTATAAKETGWRAAQTVSVESSNGFDTTEAKDRLNADDDGYDNTTVNLSVGYQFDKDNGVDFSYFNSQGRTEYDADCLDASYASVDCKPWIDHELEKVSIQANNKVNELLSLKTLLAQSKDYSQIGDDVINGTISPGSDNNFETNRDTLSIQSDWQVNKESLITAGIDYYNDQVRSNNVVYAEDERDNLALFLQAQNSIAGFHIIAGVRNDDNEQFGNHSTYSLSLGYDVSENLLATAAYGTGFNAPTFNDLYWVDPFFVGNPDLDPEESENIDLGIKWKLANSYLAVNIFQYQIDNMIAYDASVFPGTMININEAEINGFEASYNISIGDSTVATAYTYTDTEDKATGNHLQRRPLHNLSVDYDHKLSDKLAYGLTLFAQSDSYNNAANTQKMIAFGKVDARLAYQLSESVTLEAKVENLFDKDYSVTRSFNQGNYLTGGRLAYISASLSF